MTIPKQKFGFIFKCPETGCKKKPFTSPRGLNSHLTKSHNVNYRFEFDDQHRACYMRNSKAVMAKVIQKILY